MNKAINLLLLLLGIVTSNVVLPQEYKFKQNEPIKLPPFNLEDEVKGQLKKVEFIRYEAQEIFGEIKPTNIIKKRIWYFNSDNQIEKIEYYKKDSLFRVSNYFYLSDEGYDNMIIFEGEDKKEYHYRIDTNGMVTFLDYLKNGELIKKEIATYDSKKRMVSYQCFEGNGKKIEEKNFTYDLKGNIVRADNGVGIEKETAFFKFQNGKQIETKILNQVGELIWKENVIFNAKGEFSSSITQINSASEVYYIKSVNSVVNIGTEVLKIYEGESLSNLKLRSEEKIIKKINEFGGTTTINMNGLNKSVRVEDKNGMILENLYYQGGKLYTKEINKYDLMGNLISNENINFFNSTDCIDCENFEIEPSIAYKIVKYIDFDVNGNCTKVIRTNQEKNGKQLSQEITIEETKIEYSE